MNRNRILAGMLRDTADRLDRGTCILTDEQASMLIEELGNKPLSKEQASIRLGMSRSNFDRNVREGRIPHGRKVMGFKELVWFSKDIDRMASSFSHPTLRDR